MANGPELNILRDRWAALNARADRAEEAPVARAARRLVQVYDGGHMPTQADRVYLTRPVELDGFEIEGGPAVLNVDQFTTLPVVVLHGPAYAGDVLTAHAVGGRWVAESGQSQGPAPGIACGACTVPLALYLTDAYTTTILRYVEPVPAWVSSTIAGPWACPGAWIGCYSLPNQLVASGCASPPFLAPYYGNTPIRYVLGFCESQCTLHARRVWGTTNAVAGPKSAFVDCLPASDCGAVSAVCPNQTCEANWQMDSYSGPLSSCAPFPMTITFTGTNGLPSNPLGLSLVIDQ